MTSAESRERRSSCENCTARGLVVDSDREVLKLPVSEQRSGGRGVQARCGACEGDLGLMPAREEPCDGRDRNLAARGSQHCSVRISAGTRFSPVPRLRSRTRTREFGGWDHADLAVQTSVVESVELLRCAQLEVVEGAAGADEFCLEQAVDAFGQGVVIAVAGGDRL